ncbi:myosin-binding protein 7-like [Tasmannia lanceolata]|uniref:myosin-binding protein 7-like n=1 Tax=Tasmannia lanceolata TaxID=3420 RepID=UPI0040644C6F
MDSESSPLKNSVKCCSCPCSCSLISSSATWHRSVKRKSEHISYDSINSDLSVARVEIENECIVLRETVSSQQQSIQELYIELEEERNASSSAANEAMSMILRVQREKAEVQMEMRQFKRFAEERMAHDQQELEDVLYKRDQVMQSLTCEVQAYKHRLMSFGYGESEVEVVPSGHIRNQSARENSEVQFEFPAFEYPPLKCNSNETPVYPDCGFGNDEPVDQEQYAFGETPRAWEQLENLECRIYQLERHPSHNQMDGDFSSTRDFLEKVVVGQSPRWPRHGRRFSIDSSSSLPCLVKEAGQDCKVETPGPGSNLKKMKDFVSTEDDTMLTFPGMADNASDFGDDMSDRIYTIDSVHAVPYNGVNEVKVIASLSDDYVATPRESLGRFDTGETDIKKLYMRLQALEADRESMRQAVISMRTDKAQLVLLKEIAQQLYKDMSPEEMVTVKKSSLSASLSFMSVLKWAVSFVFWRKKAHRSKYMFWLSNNNVGLLLLLDKSPYMRRWRCLTRGQV